MLISLPGSKSISNRILILKYLSGQDFDIKNISNSDDTKVLLNTLNSNEKELNLGMAGTSMRFLISYFAIKEGVEVILKGEKRLNNRPVKALVEALKELGADIEYLNEFGYPPLLIKGKKINGGSIKIKSDISSQFISSLLLIAPFLEKGLNIELDGKTVSSSYIKTTLDILKYFGVKVSIIDEKITVYKCKLSDIPYYIIESDWSCASYFYSYVSLTSNPVKLKTLYDNSIQADSNLIAIYKNYFGVNTYFIDNYILLEKNKNFKIEDTINLDLLENPDIAQTIIVNCIGLGIKCSINGLQTLKIKETDRLEALHKELTKFNITTLFTDVNFSVLSFMEFKKSNPVLINTYNDHRMAMSFATLLFLNYNLEFDNKNVVNKSYPNFWNDFNSLK